MIVEHLAPVIAGVIGAILGAGGVVPLVIAIMNARRQSTQDGRDFATATFVRMEARILALEKAEKECMEAKVTLSSEVAMLREQVENMTDELRRFKNQTCVGHVECNTEGAITEFSEGAEQLFGWSRTEMVGKPIENLMPSFSRSAHREVFKEACKESHETHMVRLKDVYGATKSGSSIPLTIVLNSFLDQGKKYFDAEIHYRELK